MKLFYNRNVLAFVMTDVRIWWPDITNAEIDSLKEYSHYEWLVMRRLVGNIGGGKEISEDDLGHGVPSHSLGKLREAIKGLEKRCILLIKPKPGMRICQVDPRVYSEPVKRFAELIRTNKDLFDMMLSEKVVFIKRSDTIIRLIEDRYKGKNAFQYTIRISDKLSVLGEELGIVVTTIFHCPSGNSVKECEFEILDPRDLMCKTHIWDCECGSIHTCCAYGRLF